MHYVGVDLAWGQRSPTGVAVLDRDGKLTHVGVAGDDADVLAQLKPYVAGDCVVAFDAPLVVTNPTSNRPCEAALNRDFRRFDAGTHPGWAALQKSVATATRKSQPRRAEDPVDAVLCAYIARYATERPGEVTVYGDDATGCIVTPTYRPFPSSR